ncbi:unnamed protein product [Blepharisma stoltei]|uniref:Uncharacterized protein n=1 Tax=Blepharisma stoltei TaxID=1481888 RepID=A0AAU9JJA0_9CILI|nr:unnamed protein product [Blepharisma stoltei]
MGRYVVDILSSIANVEYIPHDQNTILLVPDTFIPSSEIEARFAPCNDIDQALAGGAFIFRVANEFQRGFLMGLILGRWPDAKLVTSRLDVYKKISPRISLQMYKENFYKLYYNDSCASTEASSEYPNSPREELKAPFFQPKPQPQQISLQEKYLDNLYYEVLNKYYEKFLIHEEIRATKIRSAKAQIKNLSDGAVISVKRKALPGFADCLPGSSELSDMVYEDLRDHKIIQEIGMQVTYDETLIEMYFGRDKKKEFKPRYKESRNQPLQPPQPPQSPIFSMAMDRDKIIETAFKEIWKDILIEVEEVKPNTIAALAYLIVGRFEKKHEEEPVKYDISFKEDIIKRAIKMLFTWDIISLQSNSEKTQDSVAENYKQNLSERLLL